MEIFIIETEEPEQHSGQFTGAFSSEEEAIQRIISCIGEESLWRFQIQKWSLINTKWIWDKEWVSSRIQACPSKKGWKNWFFKPYHPNDDNGSWGFICVTGVMPSMGAAFEDVLDTITRNGYLDWEPVYFICEEKNIWFKISPEDIFFPVPDPERRLVELKLDSWVSNFYANYAAAVEHLLSCYNWPETNGDILLVGNSIGLKFTGGPILCCECCNKPCCYSGSHCKGGVGFPTVWMD